MFSALHYTCEVLIDIPYLLKGISLFFLKFLFGDICLYVWASHMALVVKCLPATAGDIRDMGSIAGLRRSLEEGMSTHSSILAWRITWTEEPGEL